jgi:DNA primase
MEIERIDYSDAIKQLSDDYRVDLSEFESKWQSSPEYKSDKEKTKRMMKLAQDYFVSSLHTTG